MYIRRKKYPSGNVGIIVVEKISGKMKELTTIGIAKSDEEVEALSNEVRNGSTESNNADIRDLICSARRG